MRNECQALLCQRKSVIIGARNGKDTLGLFQAINRRPDLMECRPIHLDCLLRVDGRVDFTDRTGEPDLDRIKGNKDGQRIPEYPVGGTEYRLKLIAQRNRVRREFDTIRRYSMNPKQRRKMTAGKSTGQTAFA